MSILPSHDTRLTESDCARPLTGPRGRRPRRKGSVTLWLLVILPVMLILFAFVVNIAHLWLARVELENSLEAAALAAVKEWGDANGGSTVVPREVGVYYAMANTMRGEPVEIATNLNAAPNPLNPNQNLQCNVVQADPAGGIPPNGNLIFGAITEDDPVYPVTFNAGIAGGCTPADVFIDVEKADSGANVEPRMFGIFFDGGPVNLAIRSVSITLPVIHPNAYFDKNQHGIVSIEHDVPDDLNRNNPTFPNDVRGIDPDPSVTGSSLLTNRWLPPNTSGDIHFTFEDPLNATDYRTVTIHFADGSFMTTNDPDTTDFVRFGVSVHRLKPKPVKGDNNDGDAFGRLNVLVTVVFVNMTTGETSTSTGVFVDVDKDGDGDPNDGRSEASVFGVGGGKPAVRAQASVKVPLLFGQIIGFDVGSYCVFAKTTAVYDCATRRPELLRVDRYICPGP